MKITNKSVIKLCNNSLSINLELNSRLRDLRTSKGWSQTVLGEKLALHLNLPTPIPTSTIASWEHKDSNLAKIPSEDKLIALSQLFNVSQSYLLGLSDDLNENSISSDSDTYIPQKKQEILPQELPQHISEPIWVSSDIYNGWMLLTNFYTLIDADGITHNVKEIKQANGFFSIYPPFGTVSNQILNHKIIPEAQIKNYDKKMWVCIISPDKAMQKYNGWYERTPDGLSVSGKILLSFDSYFDFWIAYYSPTDCM